MHYSHTPSVFCLVSYPDPATGDPVVLSLGWLNPADAVTARPLLEAILPGPSVPAVVPPGSPHPSTISSVIDPPVRVITEIPRGRIIVGDPSDPQPTPPPRESQVRSMWPFSEVDFIQAFLEGRPRVIHSL